MRTVYNDKIQDFVYEVSNPVWIVKSVVAKSDYTLLLTFSNGETRIYNAKDLLSKKIYEPLRNLPFFMSAKVSGDTVVWNDDIDISPEHLYECSNPVRSSDRSD